MKGRQTDCCALPQLMPAAQIPCVEMVALMALSDLEQLERLDEWTFISSRCSF